MAKLRIKYFGPITEGFDSEDTFLAEEMKVSINKYKRPKIMYIPSERKRMSNKYLLCHFRA